MRPLSIQTEFTFSISRDFINIITDTFEGGIMENLDVKFGKKSSHVVKNLPRKIYFKKYNSNN